jgi:hypothetical protein
MNHWNVEYIAESRRAAIRREMEQIHLLEQASAANRRDAGWVGRRMVSLGNWMIARGRDLRCRYDFESVDCGQRMTGSLAR